MIQVDEHIKPITKRMAELHEKIRDLNNSIKWQVLNGPDLEFAQDDRREYQAEYDKLKAELLDYHSAKDKSIQDQIQTVSSRKSTISS